MHKYKLSLPPQAKWKISLLWLQHKEITKYPQQKQVKSVNFDHLSIMRTPNQRANKERTALLPEETSRELFLLPEIFNPMQHST